MEVQSLEACVQKCNDEAECKAINYFSSHQACLLQSDSLNDEQKPESRDEEGTTYVIVRGCGDAGPEPQPEEPEEPSARRKRNADCKKENVLVGGTVVGDGYVMDVKSLDDCVRKCNELPECKAVNYFSAQEACLPQSDTLNDEQKPESRDEEGTTYVIVKGCEGGDDDDDDQTTEATGTEEPDFDTTENSDDDEGETTTAY